MATRRPILVDTPASRGLAIYHRCPYCEGELLPHALLMNFKGRLGTPEPRLWHRCAQWCTRTAWRFAPNDDLAGTIELGEDGLPLVHAECSL